MSDIPMELSIWKGDYGLPSMCPECIYIMLYMKIAKVPVAYKYCTNPYWEVGDGYPIFQHGRIYTTNVQLMIGYLRIKRYGTEFGLSSKQCSQSYALANMLQNTLKPIVDYVWWLDKKNYEEFSRPWLMKTMPLPVNLLYPRQRRHKAKNLIDSMFANLDSLEVIHSYMFNAAEKCFTTLKTRLGDSKYFYGPVPTSLDAMVYAHLCPLLKLPFPSDDIPRLLKTYTELVDYLQRLDNEYFSDIIPDKKSDSVEEVASGESVPLSFKAKIITCLCVACAMVAYAITNDIVYLPNLPKYQQQPTKKYKLFF